MEDRHKRRETSSVASAKHLLQFSRESRYVGNLEDPLQRHITCHGRRQTRDDLHSKQRMAAKLEAIVVHAHLFKLEHVEPDPGHDLLERVAWSHIRAAE